MTNNGTIEEKFVLPPAMNTTAITFNTAGQRIPEITPVNRNLFSGGGEPRKLFSGQEQRNITTSGNEGKSTIDKGSFDQKPDDYKAFLAKFDKGSSIEDVSKPS
jgi:hypothetical protein